MSPTGLTWEWSGLDCHGNPELLFAFLIFAALSDGSSSPSFTLEDEVASSSWTDDLPDPPPGFVRFYDVEAEDQAGNLSSDACPP